MSSPSKPHVSPAPTAPAAELADQHAQILLEIVQMQFANMRASIMGSIIVGGLYAVAALSFLPTANVVMWLCLLTGVSLGRFGLYWRFMNSKRAAQSPLTVENAPIWLRYTTAWSGATGLVWGCAGVFLNSAHHFEVQLMLVFLATSLGIVSIYSAAAHLPTFLAFCVPSCGLLGFTLIAQANSRFSVLLGIAILVVPFILTRFARTVHANAVQSMRLRFENIKLVAQLTQEKQIATTANAQKTRFLASATHDLRQPLHAVGLFAASLKNRQFAPADAQLIDGILTAHDAMNEMFDALLDISKLDANAVTPRITDVPLQRMFNRLAIEFAPVAASSNIALVFHPTSIWVESDPILLERIVRNLVSNALRYTPAGRVLVGVRRRAPAARKSIADARSGITKLLPVDAVAHAEIQVFDTGIGINATQLDVIFEEFYQVGNPERDRQKGLGLGLSIVARLSTLLNHRVRVASRLGHGSVFALALPFGSGRPPYGVSSKSNRTTNQVTQPGATPPICNPLLGKLVLVIDDEFEIRSATGRLLLSYGVNVMLAASRADALTRLNASTVVPACILCDYRLRDGENGIDVIAAVREELAIDVPSVLITGDTNSDVINAAKRAGLPVLFKPFNGAGLLKALAKAVVESSM